MEIAPNWRCDEHLVAELMMMTTPNGIEAIIELIEIQGTLSECCQNSTSLIKTQEQSLITKISIKSKSFNSKKIKD